jgi:hypothetical protein
MVGASDVDSSSAYSTSSSSSSEDEGDWRKGRKPSKNLSGLSCLARDGFCTMALSSGRMSHPVLKAKPSALIMCAPGSSYTHA